MAVTTNLNITKLEVGQRQKEATINTALDVIDSSVETKPDFLGEFGSDPSATGVIKGSTYYNTASLKLKFLRSDGTTWANVA